MSDKPREWTVVNKTVIGNELMDGKIRQLVEKSSFEALEAKLAEVTSDSRESQSALKLKELNENIDHALIKAKVRIEELEHLLEAIRSQMCWEADRDRLTIGFKDLHVAMTAALEKDR